MKHISFPTFKLDLNFSSIAFSLFDIEIYWYSICIVLGLCIALFLCMQSKQNFEIKFIDLLDVIINGLIFGIIGARLYYVLFNLEYFLANPIKIFYLRDGGLAIYGGLILGLAIGIIRTKKLGIKIPDALDYVAPFIAIAQSIGRWGNFFNVEAYGVKTNNIFRMNIYNGENFISVHPTFLYESICTFVIFCLLRILQKNRKFDGQIFLLYLIFYSFVRFWIEGIRSDSLMFFDFRISQIVSLIIFIAGIICYFSKSRRILNKK